MLVSFHPNLHPVKKKPYLRAMEKYLVWKQQKPTEDNTGWKSPSCALSLLGNRYISARKHLLFCYKDEPLCLEKLRYFHTKKPFVFDGFFFKPCVCGIQGWDGHRWAWPEAHFSIIWCSASYFCNLESILKAREHNKQGHFVFTWHYWVVKKNGFSSRCIFPPPYKHQTYWSVVRLMLTINTLWCPIHTGPNSLLV